MIRTILVFGGTGAVCAPVARQLRNDGYQSASWSVTQAFASSTTAPLRSPKWLRPVGVERLTYVSHTLAAPDATAPDLAAKFRGRDHWLHGDREPSAMGRGFEVMNPRGPGCQRPGHGRGVRERLAAMDEVSELRRMFELPLLHPRAGRRRRLLRTLVLSGERVTLRPISRG
jgi:hypothetical protein